MAITHSKLKVVARTFVDNANSYVLSESNNIEAIG